MRPCSRLRTLLLLRRRVHRTGAANTAAPLWTHDPPRVRPLLWSSSWSSLSSSPHSGSRSTDDDDDDNQQQHDDDKDNDGGHPEHRRRRGGQRPSSSSSDHRPPDMERFDTSALARRMRAEVRAYTALRRQRLPRPHHNNDNDTTTNDTTTRRRRRNIRLAGLLAIHDDNRADGSSSSSSSTGTAAAAARAYSNQIAQAFRADGFDYELVECNNGGTPQDVEQVIRQLNERSDVDGVLVFYPIFPQRTADLLLGGGVASNNTTITTTTKTYLNPSNGVHYKKSSLPYYLNAATGVHYKTIDDYLRDCVIPTKDVEGLCHREIWQRRLFRTRATPTQGVYIPCTAMSVWKILQYYYSCDSSSFGQPPHPKQNEPPPQHAPAAAPEDGRYDDDGTIIHWPPDCNVTIINRSTILGRPLAALLASEGVFANIYSLDDRTILHYYRQKPDDDDNDHHHHHHTGGATASGGGRTTTTMRLRRCGAADPHNHHNHHNNMTLTDCIARSHIIVTAVPDPQFQIPLAALRPNALVVDVTGTNVIHNNATTTAPSMLWRRRRRHEDDKEDTTDHDDADTTAHDNDDSDNVKRQQTPPPGGVCGGRGIRLVTSVGKITIATLQQSLIRLFQESNKDDEHG